MASIQKITEFKAGREVLSDTHYTVYYDTGRRVNYYGRDTLPMTVVNFLTDENTVSETVYIEDNYLHCVNSRTTYTPADKPQESLQEAPAAEAEQQPTETENAPQAATQVAEDIEITAITYTTDDDLDPAPGLLIHRPGTTRGIIIGNGVMLPDDPADLLTAYGEREYNQDAAGNYIIPA